MHEAYDELTLKKKKKVERFYGPQVVLYINHT